MEYCGLCGYPINECAGHLIDRFGYPIENEDNE